jgi:ABC-2 type transport system ATP-binding protein
VIVIHHGTILFDGQLSALSERFGTHKTIEVTLQDPSVSLSSYGEVISRDAEKATIRVARADTSRIAGRLLNDLPVVDLTIEDLPIEDVIEQTFAGGS